MLPSSLDEKENFFKNLFRVLAAEPGVKFKSKRSLSRAAGDLSVDGETLNRWFDQWKRDPNTPPLSTGSENLIYLLAAALSFEENIDAAVLNRLGELAGNGEARAVADLVNNSKKIREQNNLGGRAELIARLASGSPRDEAPYIANQVTYEGLDEIQRLLLAHAAGTHVAIDGPPGVGKTRGVIEIAGILGLPLFTKTCSSRTTESHIISHPVLDAREGVSVTRQVNGPLARAMESGGIFYGDEFNLLKEDVQKRLNSAFDERREIDRADGEVVTARPGFWAVLSYNPTESLVSRDLEDSVADRFVHLHFRRWDADFKAFVSWLKARGTTRDELEDKNEFDVSLAWRGIGAGREFLRGKSDGAGGRIWYDFFSGEPATSKPVFEYLVHDRGSLLRREGETERKALANLASQAFKPVDLARMLSRFTELLFTLSRTGESPLLKKIGLGNLPQKEDLELLQLHESSARIEMAALRHYEILLAAGCNRYLAQSYAVRLVIDQLCYGPYREKRLRETTAHGLVVSIARSMRLMAESGQYNTKMITEDLLRTRRKSKDT